MPDRETLVPWVIEALQASGGSASVIEVCKTIWEKHEEDLRGAGDLFYTWQYDVRWVAQSLRKQGKLKESNSAPKGIWALR